MSKIFDDIKKGLNEAIDHANGNNDAVLVYKPKPVDVKAVREKTGMTQERFAACFGISPATLRHWERGDRTPRGAALVLLNLLDKDPETILQTLHAS